MKLSMLSKLRNLHRYFYQVPWCVPTWGWKEFCVTMNCILTGHLSKGPYPRRFADAVKDYLGIAYALHTNRGRVAIELALRAIGLDKNHDVILPSYICHSVLDAVVRVGARPVFADVGPDLHLTPETVKTALTAQTRCVIVPHLFGNTAPIDEIETMLEGTGIALIDDAAQSFGSRRAGRLVGTFGDCGIISCGPGKTLAGVAGGLLVTNNREIYERAATISLCQENAIVVMQRVLSFWIWRRLRKYTLPFKIIMDRVFGVKEETPYVACVMSNLDARIALEQFYALGKNTQKRRYNATILLKALGPLANYNISDLSHNSTLVKLVLVLPPKEPTPNQVINLLSNAGIECQKGYVPLHLHMRNVSVLLPFTDNLWDRVVCIPVDIEYKGIKKPLPFTEKRPKFESSQV